MVGGNGGHWGIQDTAVQYDGRACPQCPRVLEALVHSSRSPQGGGSCPDLYCFCAGTQIVTNDIDDNSTCQQRARAALVLCTGTLPKAPMGKKKWETLKTLVRAKGSVY